MKAHTLILGLIACFVLSGNAAVFSQDSEDVPQKRGSGKFKKMDTDGDGQISLDEFLARAEQRFEKMDGDEDGYVTATEYKEKRKGMRAKSRERRGKRQGDMEEE